VLLVGAGGLGSPAAYYLAAAGIGRLRIVDDDAVDRSNLQRQILHTEAGIGTAKVESARQALRALNPRVHVEPVRERVTVANVEALLADVDVVLDGADNFPTRYLLSDACVRFGKPLVYGAVHRFEGQASVFDAGRHPGESPCYRCLFPEPPRAAEAPNCAEAGVLGVLPGVIGLLQATEAVKLVLGIGTSLSGGCCSSTRCRCASAKRACARIPNARGARRRGGCGRWSSSARCARRTPEPVGAAIAAMPDALNQETSPL
jgi:molybdopterin/thiamine biosynthesis adenylyltransferase